MVNKDELKKGDKVRCIDPECCDLPIGEYEYIGHGSERNEKQPFELYDEEDKKYGGGEPWVSCGKCIEKVEAEKVSIHMPYDPSETKHDDVNHPKHYTNHPSGIECIQVTEHMNFNLGNAVKYIWRSDLKGKDIEDLEKAEFYIRREIRRRYLEKEKNKSENN